MMERMNVMGKYTKKINEEHSFYKELCEEHYVNILRYCNAHLGYNYENLAEECAQNTFLQALQCIKKLMEHPNVGGWLYMTAENFVKRTLREIKKEKMRYISLDDENNNTDSLLACTDELEGVLEENINVDEFKDAVLSQLNNDEYELYSEYYVYKKSLIYIMDKFKLSESAAKSRIFRLRRRLNDMIRKLF